MENTESIKVKESSSSNKNKSKYVLEFITEKIFMISAFVAVISLLLIIGFVFYKGLMPFVTEGYSFIDFIFRTEWLPSSKEFGIGAMIVTSMVATVGALIIGVPIGILAAIFIAEICPKKYARVISTAVELLAGIPSVLYGIFGLAVIIVLSIMMLPTIISLSETSIRAVPKAYKEGSLALGASKIETIFKVTVPAAKSGILAGVILGIGRALGETMAVILVAGNSTAMPTSLLDSARPLTTNIALEMGYAAGTHQEMLFATGVVLFLFIIIINLVLTKLTSKGVDR